MPPPTMDIRIIKDVLRLNLHGRLSHEAIARSLSISKGVVAKDVSLATAGGLQDWASVAALGEAEPERRLFGAGPEQRRVVEPDFGRIHLALRRKGVTLTLLWEEYRAANEGRRTWGLTQFCEHYKTYSKTLCRSMRHLGGVPQMIVPDNARALIADPNRYEPRANDTVLDFARHHDVTILPARPYRPQDKAKVESAVQVVERRLECIGDLADGVASAQSAYTGQLTLPRASRDL